MITTEDEKVWLPDDLEERWEVMSSTEHRALRALWIERNAEGRMDWRQRRRIRKMLGGPLNLGYAVTTAARLEEIEQARQARFRRIRRYGEDGEREIQTLVCKLGALRPGIPDASLLAWAEKTYRRENHLD